MLKDSLLWLGIDGGGSSTKVRLEDSAGQLLATAESDTSHPIHGIDIAASNILSATQNALSAANLKEQDMGRIVACGGYAGVHLQRFEKLLSQWQAPFFRHYITTDLHVACIGAHQGKDGGMIILGTGFSAMANISGVQKLIGGQGFLLGDIASGAWFGLQAVRYALNYWDGLTPHSAIVELIQDVYGVAGNELADKLIQAAPNEFARAAKGIFDLADAGDAAANQILSQAVTDVEQIIGAIQGYGIQNIAIYGSVGTRIKHYLQPAFQCGLISPEQTPEQGALLLARELAAKDPEIA